MPTKTRLTISKEVMLLTIRAREHYCIWVLLLMICARGLDKSRGRGVCVRNDLDGGSFAAHRKCHPKLAHARLDYQTNSWRPFIYCVRTNSWISEPPTHPVSTNYDVTMTTLRKRTHGAWPPLPPPPFDAYVINELVPCDDAAFCFWALHGCCAIITYKLQLWRRSLKSLCSANRRQNKPPHIDVFEKQLVGIIFRATFGCLHGSVIKTLVASMLYSFVTVSNES